MQQRMIDTRLHTSLFTLYTDRRPTAADCAVVTQDTFKLGAIHIDETVACSESQATALQRTWAVQSTVAGIDESMPFHSESLEDALPSDEQSGGLPCSTERRRHLQELLLASSLPVICSIHVP